MSWTQNSHTSLFTKYRAEFRLTDFLLKSKRPWEGEVVGHLYLSANDFINLN